MPIFDKYKTIFVHIPKCAGTSVSNAFADGEPSFNSAEYKKFSLRTMKGRNLEHQTSRRLKLLAPFRFRKYYKFAFVRNPFDRMVSEYKWRSSWDESTRNADFENMLEKIPSFRDAGEPHFFSAKQFVTDGRGKVVVDFIGKFESIDEDFAKIAKAVNLNKSLPKKNVTNKQESKYCEYYNSTTKRLVEQYFGEDLAFFDYKFEDK
jgi:chondroitin 4-sulfotransferase 11